MTVTCLGYVNQHMVDVTFCRCGTCYFPTIAIRIAVLFQTANKHIVQSVYRVDNMKCSGWVNGSTVVIQHKRTRTCAVEPVARSAICFKCSIHVESDRWGCYRGNTSCYADLAFGCGR